MVDLNRFFSRVIPPEQPPQPPQPAQAEIPGKRPTLHLRPGKPVEPEKAESPLPGETTAMAGRPDMANAPVAGEPGIADMPSFGITAERVTEPSTADPSPESQASDPPIFSQPQTSTETEMENEMTCLVEFQELLFEQEEIAMKVEAARKKAVGEAVIRMRTQIALLGITARDLGLADAAGTSRSSSSRQAGNRGTSPVAPKYRDRETGSTWTGRGREPAWIRGKDRNQYLIEGGQQGLPLDA